MTKKSNKKQNQHIIQRCIYCNNVPLTREHLWPHWIKDIIPVFKENIHHHVFKYIDFFRDTINIQPDIKHFSGHMSTRTLKIVCSSCNNGWMSDIENKAKPVLEALILNQPEVITQEAQSILISWAISRTIIGEFTDRRTRTVTKSERVEFMQTKSGAPYWKVWIAKNKVNEWEQKYHHTGATVALRNPQGIVEIPKLHNCQHTMLIIGKLIVYTYKSPYPNIPYILPKGLAEKMEMIYPENRKNINWKSLLPLSDTEKEELPKLLENFLLFHKK